MRMDRFLLSVLAFVLLVITIVFFRDNNMYWWPFMFSFIITAGFLANSVDYPEAICRHGKIVINSGKGFNEDETEEKDVTEEDEDEEDGEDKRLK